jgi:hypothetical protein
VPVVVHHLRVSPDLWMRLAKRVAGDRRTSQFPCEMYRWVRRVSNRAGSHSVSTILDTRWRPDGCSPSAFHHGVAIRSGHGSRRGSDFSAQRLARTFPRQRFMFLFHERLHMTRAQCVSLRYSFCHTARHRRHLAGLTGARRVL